MRASAGTVMMGYGTALGFVGLAYAGVDCFAETIRGACECGHVHGSHESSGGWGGGVTSSDPYLGRRPACAKAHSSLSDIIVVEVVQLGWDWTCRAMDRHLNPYKIFLERFPEQVRDVCVGIITGSAAEICASCLPTPAQVTKPQP